MRLAHLVALLLLLAAAPTVRAAEPPPPVDLIFDTIEKIRESGVTILLVEQNALAALRVADYAYVLESGKLKLQGPARELAENDEVQRAYLGG